MYGKLQKDLQDELKAIEEAGLYKKERIITCYKLNKIANYYYFLGIDFC